MKLTSAKITTLLSALTIAQARYEEHAIFAARSGNLTLQAKFNAWAEDAARMYAEILAEDLMQ